MFDKNIPELMYLPKDSNGTYSNIMIQRLGGKGYKVTLLRRRYPNSRKAYWYELVYRDEALRVVVEEFHGSEAGVEDARFSAPR